MMSQSVFNASAWNRHALLTCEEMQCAEKTACVNGITSFDLMQRAGEAIAKIIREKFEPCRVLVLCGPGNNGGDGFIAAEQLRRAGWDATVASATSESKGDAARAAQNWQGKTLPLNNVPFDGIDLVIDALFGTGLKRAIEDNARTAIEKLAQTKIPVVSVDLPSGVNGDTGAIMGVAPQAAFTVTFFRKKPGHLLLPGARLCGEVVVADIGIGDEVLEQWSFNCANTQQRSSPLARLRQEATARSGLVTPKLEERRRKGEDRRGVGSARAEFSSCGENPTPDPALKGRGTLDESPEQNPKLHLLAAENNPDLWLDHFPFSKSGGNKYTRGHALIAGGAVMTGATRLAARAAQRVGAGLVTLAAPESAMAIYSTALESVIVRAVDTLDAWQELLADAKRNVVLIGPGLGLGAAQADFVLAALATHKPCVLDADALGNFTGRSEELFSKLHAQCVLTPHEGEFARLFGAGIDTHEDKLTRVRKAAKIAGCIVLLKGADTMIADPEGRVIVNVNAPPWLATAGAGDVLAGLILGLLAQNRPVFSATAAAAWIHGQAADAFGPGLIAEDLVTGIPAALQGLPEIGKGV